MDKNKQALLITKALAYAENGGKPGKPVAGKTGEMKSIFQFTPDTWKLYSKQIAGKELPLTSENEAFVVNGKVQKWLDDGHTVEEIASMWNAGEQRPDAYKQNWKGINKKYGVAYDTPAYASKVKSYHDSFAKGDTQEVPQLQLQNTKEKTEAVDKIRSFLDKVKSGAGQPANTSTPPVQPPIQQNSPTQPSAGLLPNLTNKI